MSTLSEQAAALRHLSNLYLAAMAKGCKLVSFTHPDASEVVAFTEKAGQEQAGWYGRVVAAQRRLLASGFDVPDSWLLADTMGSTPIHATGPEDSPVLTVEVLGPDASKLGQIIDEMRVALIRLSAQPSVPAAAGEPPADAKSQPETPPQAVPAEEVGRLLHLVGDGDGIRILSVAKNQDLTADQRMRALVAIDKRMEGYDSTKWAELLAVQSAAIRQTDFWKTRKHRKEWDE